MILGNRCCFSHDIGNPPFGHSGEKRLGNISLSERKIQRSTKEWQDLIDFEGNANGFTVLTGSRPGIEVFGSLCYFGSIYEIPKGKFTRKPTNIADNMAFKLIRYSLKK
jgi:dGTPase